MKTHIRCNFNSDDIICGSALVWWICMADSHVTVGHIKKCRPYKMSPRIIGATIVKSNLLAPLASWDMRSRGKFPPKKKVIRICGPGVEWSIDSGYYSATKSEISGRPVEYPPGNPPDHCLVFVDAFRLFKYIPILVEIGKLAAAKVMRI